jgi:predicted permease
MLLRRRKFDRDMDEEMRLHLELREKEQRENGAAPQQSYTEARKNFGNALAMREASHDAWGWTWLEQFGQDLRYSFRLLRKSPGFTAVAVLTLALGIGANTAIFSIIDAVFLRPLPYGQPNRLVYALWVGSDETEDSVGAADYLFWKQHSHVFDSASAYQPNSGSNLVVGQQAYYVQVTSVSPGLFATLGISPMLGTEFTPEEGQPSSAHAAILSYGLWRSLFAADPHAIGRNVQMNGQDYVVAGILPRDFQFVAAADLYTPLQLTFNSGDHDQNYGMVARLRPGVSLQQAQADMDGVFGLFKQMYPGDVWKGWRGLRLIPYSQELTGNVRTPLLVLFGAVSLVLLIVIANVTSLLLGRASARHTEIALRAAIGAGGWRLARQLTTEGLLLAGSGGGLGLLFAYWGLRWLVGIIPQSVSIDLSTSLLPLGGQIPIDVRVLAFTLLVSVLAGVAAGLFPSLQTRGTNLYEELKEGGRNAGLHLRHPRVRNILVTTEIGTSLVLLVGAGLLTESFLKLRSVNPGFNPQALWAVEMSLPPQRYTTTAQTWTLQQRVMQQLQTIPGVASVATTSNLPVERGLNYPFNIPGCGRLMVQLRAISPAYFQVMGIPLLSGREFLNTDQANSVILNSELAHRCWPGRNPVGQAVAKSEVVGVVGDTKEGALDNPPLPVLYVPQWSVPDGFTRLVHGWFLSAWVIRSNAPLNLKAVTQAVHAADPTLPVAHFKPMTVLIADSFVVAKSRLLAMLLDGFTALALLLAVIGIYGVLSYLVTQRTHEIGVRIALGAQRGDVLRLVVGQGAMLAGIGIVIGIAAAFGLMRLMASLLYGVTPLDPLTFIGVAILLLAVALAACYIPARRAMRVDPMAALRYE